MRQLYETIEEREYKNPGFILFINSGNLYFLDSNKILDKGEISYGKNSPTPFHLLTLNEERIENTHC